MMLLDGIFSGLLVCVRETGLDQSEVVPMQALPLVASKANALSL